MRKSKGMLLLLLAGTMLAAQGLAVSGADENEWTITLDYNDGASRNGAIFVEKSESATLPTTPIRKGYSFVGWADENGQTVETVYQPTQDVVLTAQWTIGQCAVTLVDSDNENQLGEMSIQYGSALEGLPEVTKEGYSLRYWSLSENGERLDTENFTVKNDTTLYAVWLEDSKKEYRVTFKQTAFSDEMQGDKELYVVEGGSVKKSDAVKNLEREGYKFEGWTSEAPAEGNDWTIDEYPAKNKPSLVKIPLKPKADTDLYAVWTIQQYMAIFNANYTDSEYKNGVVYSYKLLSNESVEAPAEAPVRENYVFDGWYSKATGGEKIDFADGVKLKANTGFYAHWTHEPVQTDTFQAEYTPFDPDQKYFGYSGSVQGANCIVKDAGTVGTVSKDEYPTNSKLEAGNGYYVSYQYERGDTLSFHIHSSKATKAKLLANLAVEVDSMDIGSEGESATAIRVNGKDIPYNLTILRIFKEYEIAEIELNEGDNLIEFVVNNDNTVMGGTYRAVGFMTDYIKLADSDAVFTWSPIYDNLEMN